MIRLLRGHHVSAPAYAGLAIIAALLFTAVLGPPLLRASPWEIIAKPFIPPGAPYLFGTDYLGRDVFVDVITGARASLLIGASAAAVVVLIGLAIGAAAGYYGGTLDTSLMRITEFFQIMPPILFAMALVAIFSPPRIWMIILAIGVANWTRTARLVRGEFLALRNREFVQASQAAGASDLRIIAREVLPNAVPIIIVNGALTVGDAILFEAGLSFLGLNDPNVMSWGYAIGASRLYLREAWWAVTFPGLAIVATVVGIVLTGDWLNELLNPRHISRAG